MTETEVKIRLASEQEYDRFLLALNPPTYRQFTQLNVFFDGQSNELRESKTAVRLRRNTEQNGTVEYVLTVKSRLKIENGISIASESEQLVSESTALLLLSDPSAVFANIDTLCTHHIQLEVMKHICKEVVVSGKWKEYGRFENVRKSIPWNTGLLIELDKTTYASMNNAVAYEIEIETTGERITEAKQEMQVKSFIIVTYNSHSEEFLRKHSIPFTYSKRSKLHNMLAGSIE